jgi:hypothetical protein
MLDKLNRLEKLGFIDSVEKWQTVRNIRNQFAHDYPDDLDKKAAQLNLAFASTMDLYDMLSTVSAKLKAEYPALELGKSLSISPPAWVRTGWPAKTGLTEKCAFHPATSRLSRKPPLPC